MTSMPSAVRRRGPAVAFAVVLTVTASGMAADPAATPREVVFSTEIAPLLRDACTGCHGETEDEGRLLKGGVVVFAFRQAVDYSAFWQQLVGGERPKGLSGHAGTRAEAVYGAVLVPSAGPDTPDVRLLLTEQICGAALLARGAPDWFARGAGRAVAMRLVPQAPLVQEWKRAVPAAVRDIGSCASFLGGHASPGPSAAVAGGFVGSLGSVATRLGPLVGDLDAGMAFDEAFTKAFRGAPPRLYEAWAAKEVRRTSAKR